MAQYVTPSQLDGFFKEVYGDDVVNLVPESAKFVKLVRFSPADKEEGEKYNQPVVLSNEHGVTYASAGDGAFTLKDSISMTMKNAEINGAQILLRTSIPYETAARASNSKKAFAKATEMIVENMMESVTKRLEIAYFYGGTGLGKTSSSTNSSSTKTVVTLTEASWAAGIWSGMEDAKINFYNGSSIVSSGSDAIFTISAVDIENRKLTVTGTSTGISALDTSIGSGTRDIYFDGAYGKELKGLDYILTTSGSVFGIDNSAYALWAGNSYSCGSANLTMGKILAGVGKPVARGLNEDLDLFVNPTTWGNLNGDLAALRKFDQSYSRRKLENGTEAIVFHGQNGEIRVHSHNIVKLGDAFAAPLKRCKRVGSTDVTFKSFANGERMFRELSDSAGFELRLYTSQALLLETPARAVKFTSIVNS